jgi:hypothetical protein
MNLIDRYIDEVGRHLPEKDRSDIEAEIRSMVEDMIEERGQQPKSADDKVITETLEELGDPKSLANKYSPAKRYLIGPDWYDLYVTTLKRVLSTALPIVAIVAFTVALAKDSLDFVNAVGQAFGGVIDVGTGILFWVTVGFIIAERTDANPAEMGAPKTKAWTVDQLPKTPAKRQISVGETLTNIVFFTIFVGWIILPPFFAWLRGDEGFVHVFHPDLWNIWFPIFFVIAVLTLILESFKLKIGNWTPALTVSNVILCIGSIIYIVGLVTTQEIFNPAFLATLTESVAAEELGNVASWAKWTVNISAAIIIGIYVWDMVDSVIKARRLVR